LFVVVEKKESGEFVGMAALKIDIPKNADAELGICLVKKCWGQGYGTEIMEWLVGYGFKGMALHRFSLGLFSFNNRALSLYKHFGFTVEGVKREALWFEGKRADIMWMGLLK
ncbi:acyl-CoA N-acyltransferase, partial [Stereum hirsutum FP-91666 SS1]|uniref:acyl-CoA N-acyltransferase n=1 Tax=Stereum hirsutum (strain FP-91666) TaxID=721885 RepID=UPI000440B7F1